MTQTPSIPSKIITALAPIRICDNGGWTDTWFARYGRIFNIAVAPYAEVQIQAFQRGTLPGHVLLEVEDFGDHYAVDPRSTRWDRHPLLEAAIHRIGVPDELAIRVSISCAAPAGASTGTSAAVTVALIGALDALTPGRMTPRQAAYSAHAVETEMLHRQCGVQDQISSAYGGINLITVTEYPQAEVMPIPVEPALTWELERRLSLIYLGNSHDSSQVHERVIAELEGAGPDTPRLEDLRHTAEASHTAVISGDFAALGQAMIANTEAQTRLHPALVSADAERVIRIAHEHGAIGWKVNGAGGEGGSITLLSGPEASARRAMLREIAQEDQKFIQIPIHLDQHGLRVWSSLGDM